MPIVALNKPFLYLKIFQFVLGIVVYSLMVSQVWKKGGAGNCSYGGAIESVAGVGITQVATVAFPFVILPVIFICSFIQGEGLEKHLMCALLSVGGFFSSLTAGILTCAKFHSGGPNAAGALCIIYSFAYLVDIGWFVYSTYYHPPE